MTMIRKQFFVDAAVSQRLKRLAASRRVSEAELIRQGVDKVLSDPAIDDPDWRQQLQAFAGRSKAGDFSDLADRVQQIKTEQAGLSRKRHERMRAQWDKE